MSTDDLRISFHESRPKKKIPTFSSPSDILTTEKAREAKIKNDDAISDIKLKKIVLYWVIVLVSIYLLAVLFILCWKGLSDKVLIALLTTTTANILGLPYLIIRCLYPSNKDNS